MLQSRRKDPFKKTNESQGARLELNDEGRSNQVRITLFQSTSWPAACSSRANDCFHPPLQSIGSHNTPLKSLGISNAPCFRAHTFSLPRWPMKYPSSRRTFCLTRGSGTLPFLPLSSSGVSRTMAKHWQLDQFLQQSTPTPGAEDENPS